MNLDQYFALKVTSLDAKVAWKSYQEQLNHYNSMLEDLDAAGDQAVSAAYLREAMIAMNRLHQAHLEAVGALVINAT